MSQPALTNRLRAWAACAVALIAVLCACNLPSEVAAEDATPSPTVTLTAGPGTVYPTWTMPAPASQPAPVDAGTPTATVFTLPPTPGVTPTELSSPNATHIAGSPSAGDAFIESFTASPAEIDPGGSVTLTWKAQGDSFALFRLSADGRLDQGTTVAAQGSTTLSVDPSLRNNAQFMLSATARGTTVTALAKVSIRCPDPWFFANPPNACPSGPASVSSGASERFEQGRMLYVDSSQTIYVLYERKSPSWSSYANQWHDGMSEFDPAIIAPSGLYQPVRGFGLLWRTQDAGKPASPRTRLGWATEPEASFTISFQCDALHDSNCWVSLPDGSVIWLKPNSSGWRPWTGS